MNRTIPRRFLIFSLVFGVAAAARADVTLTLNPSADSLLSASNPNSNYGGAGALEVSAAGAPNGEFQALMRFDLAGLKTGFDSAFGAGLWTVSNVTLRLNEASPAPLPAFFNPSAPGQIGVSWMKNAAWTEGTGSPMNGSVPGVTFNSLAALLSTSDQSMGSIGFDGKTAGVTAYSLTAASGFQSDAHAGNMTSLRFGAADAAVSALFTSNNNSTSPPLLSVTASAAVPEPSSMALVGAGSAFMAGNWLRRRRMRARQSREP